MTIQKMKTINTKNFNEINLNERIIVWSKIGNGTITFLRKELEALGFYFFEIRATEHDLSVSDPAMKAKLETIRDNGKKIAFVFDEISHCHENHNNGFQEAVISNRVSGFHLYNRDVVIGSARIDSNGVLMKGHICDDVINYVEHYKIDLKQ